MSRVFTLAVCLASALGASPSRAGVLSEVVGGLKKAAGDPPQKPETGGGGSHGDDVVGAIVNGLFNGFEASSPPGDATPVGYYSYAPPPADGTDTYFYAGLQDVEGSDGSMTMELRATYDEFGIALRGTSFYERVGLGEEEESIHLDLGTIGGVYRALREDRTELWLEGGLGGVSTVDALSFWGLYAGARLDRKLGGELGASLEARHFVLEDDVRVTEVRGGVRIAIVRVSYRVVDFNVGPALKGPEIGLAFLF